MQSIANAPEPNYEVTTRLRAKAGEFFKAGYAGKDVNDRLKEKADSIRADYDRKLEAHRKREQGKRDRVKHEMKYLLFQLERIVCPNTHPHRNNAWREVSGKFFEAGYPGKEAKVELLKQYNHYKDQLAKGYERDAKHRKALRKSKW